MHLCAYLLRYNPPSCLRLDDLKNSFTTLLSVKLELETITNGISVRILFQYVVTSDMCHVGTPNSRCTLKMVEFTLDDEGSVSRNMGTATY